MPRRTTSSTSRPQLLRLKPGTGDDTIHADGATVPSDGTRSMSPGAPRGNGHSSEVEIYVVAVDDDGTALARGTCSFTVHCVHIEDRQADAGAGETWPDVAVSTAPLATQAPQTAIRVAWNGGVLFVGLTAIANAPFGTTGFQIWAKPVAG